MNYEDVDECHFLDTLIEDNRKDRIHNIIKFFLLGLVVGAIAWRVFV
jgi:hypothetical protein